jgi:hypothetical protein
MSELDLTFINRALVKIQAEMRTIREENSAIRQELALKANRAEIMHIVDRFVELEVSINSRFNTLEARFEQMQTAIEKMSSSNTVRSVE